MRMRVRGRRHVEDMLLQNGSIIIVPLDDEAGSSAQLWLRPGHGRLRNQSLCLWMVLGTQGSSMITSAAATAVAAQHEPHAAIAMHQLLRARFIVIVAIEVHSGLQQQQPLFLLRRRQSVVVRRRRRWLQARPDDVREVACLIGRRQPKEVAHDTTDVTIYYILWVDQNLNSGSVCCRQKFKEAKELLTRIDLTCMEIE